MPTAPLAKGKSGARIKAAPTPFAATVVEYPAIYRAKVGRKRMRPEIGSEIPTPSPMPGASADSEQRTCRGVV